MAEIDLKFINYDPDAVWRRMHETYIDSGGDVLYPGDEKEILLRSVQAIIEQSLAVVDIALKMDTLTYAEGDFLDLYGEKRGCERLEAVKAKATVSMVFSQTGISKTISAGFAMTPDGTRIYKTVSDIAVTGSAQTVSAIIEANEAGTAGNALASGLVMHTITTDSAISSITVTQAASGGLDEEDDDSYRERIRTYGLAKITTGPAQAYESFAKEVSTDIIDAKALHGQNDAVNVYLIIKSGANVQAMIAAVTAALSADTVRPLSDNVTVSQSTAIPYTLNVQYQADAAAGLSTALANAVAEYKAWQENVIGRAFNPDMLSALLYKAGATRVVFGAGSSFNGGTVQYTTIDSDKHCSGTITLAVIDDD